MQSLPEGVSVLFKIECWAKQKNEKFYQSTYFQTQQRHWEWLCNMLLEVYLTCYTAVLF